MRTLLFISVCLVLLCFSCTPNEDENALDITTFQEKIPTPKQESTFVIDVRTAEEYAEEHHKLAQNIDYKSNDFKTKIEVNYGKSDTLLLYCKSGNRSEKAAKIARQLGFQNVYYLKESSKELFSEK